MKKIQIKKLSGFLMVCLMFFSFSIQAFAEEIEVESDEQWDYIENDPDHYIENPENYVDGIYNDVVDENELNAKSASLTGIIRLASSDGELFASYTTSYPYTATKIGVKNVKLQYQNSLKIWTNAITLDDRHRTNSSYYTGYFTCRGVFNRTYRLKATHYVVYNGKTQTKSNITETLKF